MKKLLVSLLVLLMLVACSNGKDSDDKDTVYKIGILQLMDHPSLQETKDGMVERLNELIGEDAYVLDYQNAQNDKANIQLMAQNLADADLDLIYAIATPAAQAVYAATQEAGTPVVFNAITDPVEAGLVASLANPGANATGVSDEAPIDLQLKLIQDIMPNTKNIGILYNTGEDNSRVQLEIAKEEAGKLGMNIVTQGVSSPSEIEDAATQIMDKVDVIYNITDNMIVNATAQVVGIANEANIPVFASEAGQLDQGILGTSSISYKELGRIAGDMIKEILVDKKDPKEMSVLKVTETKLYINLDVAEKLGIEISEDILALLD